MTFDSCVYVTEVNFHWFLNYGHRSRSSEGRSTLGKLVYIDPRREKLAKTYKPNSAPLSIKVNSDEIQNFIGHLWQIFTDKSENSHVARSRAKGKIFSNVIFGNTYR